MVMYPLSTVQLERLDLNRASRLANVASAFLSEAYVRYDRGHVHVGSLLGVATLPSLVGSRFVLEVNGEDEEMALAAILQAWNG